MTWISFLPVSCSVLPFNAYLKNYSTFQVVGDNFDENQEAKASKYFETMYALLDSVSPGYSQSFGEALIKKLSSLQPDGAVDDDQANCAIADEKTDDVTTASWQQ